MLITAPLFSAAKLFNSLIVLFLFGPFEFVARRANFLTRAGWSADLGGGCLGCARVLIEVRTLRRALARGQRLNPPLQFVYFDYCSATGFARD
jgi:hypothetical protein